MGADLWLTDGLQAVQLEDGTTAYITTAGAEALFTEGAQLESTQLTLEQLNQVSRFYTDLANGVY